MKARRALLAAGAVLVALAVPAGATAHGGAHPRHVQVFQPTVWAKAELGTHGGYEERVDFFEPDLAVLYVSKVDWSRLGIAVTKYGTHFRGSPLGGRVSADFGALGSIALRFRPGGPVHEPKLPKACEGKPSRSEAGHWVGNISLHGEGDYFAVSAGSVPGELRRTFRVRCHVRKPISVPPPESLLEHVFPQIGSSLASALLGTLSSVEAESREGGRLIGLRAGHTSGSGPGAEVEAGVFEYEGGMPVGRLVEIGEAPAGTLTTTLPGEHPAAAALKPGRPFVGEASYLAAGPTDHRWTGTLAARFPGLTVPLAGPGFYSTLCVVSPLVKPGGCEFQLPNWESEEPLTAAAVGR